jgi:hypothetical protein
MATPPASRHSKKTTSAPITDTDLRHHQQELGLFGKIFGSKEQAPIYFAGTLALVALVAMCVVAFTPTAPEKSDLLKGLAGIVIAALTFLGGAYGARSH